MTDDADLPTCFVAMPNGRSDAERLAYRGWLHAVYAPALKGMYRLELAASNPEPVPIGDQILRHLVDAPMAVFDLGGFVAGDVANPNVMYELGIRHAFHKPAIVYAIGDCLPFDVKPGRAVICPRSLDTAETVRVEIRRQIEAAASGQFWKPMEAVEKAEILKELSQRRPDLQLIVEQFQDFQEALDVIRSEVRDFTRSRWLSAYHSVSSGMEAVPAYTLGSLMGVQPAGEGPMASPSVKRPRAANLEKFRESLGAPNWNEPSGAENEE